MSAKHTPGPWAVGNHHPLLFGIPHGNGTEPLGFVYGPSFPERSEVGQRALANVRLIAAAPELLRAAELAFRHIDQTDPMREHVAKVLRTAIAKATEAA